MTLRHIKIFIAVCETGSTVKASSYLNLAQPSISLAIKELENYYGIKLFDRISRKLILTEAGENFLKYARIINNSFISLETQIKDYDQTKQLSIGASLNIGTFFLPDVLKEFQIKHPETNLMVQVKDSASIVEQVNNNKIDIGLIESSDLNSLNNLKTIIFNKDKLVLIVNKIHKLAGNKKVSLDELEHEQFVLRESGSIGREFLDSIFKSHNLNLKPIWESISNEAIINFVSNSLGISILPDNVVKHCKNKQIKIIELDDVIFSRQHLIIYHKNKYLTHGAIDLINTLRN